MQSPRLVDQPVDNLERLGILHHLANAVRDEDNPTTEMRTPNLLLHLPGLPQILLLLDATGPVEDPDQSSKIPLSLLHLLLTGETAHEGSTATQKSSLPKQIIEQHRLQTHKTLPNN